VAAGKSPSTAATERAGVRASIVAQKGRNGPGAKGRRKVDEESPGAEPFPATQCLRAQSDADSTRRRRSRVLWTGWFLMVMMILCGGCALWPTPRCLLLSVGRVVITPLRGKTTDWRAGCGRPACPVRREGCVKKTRKRHAVRKMKVGPSKPLCRGRLQTAISCFGQKPRW
jgi:hypothetical protein